MMVVSLNRFENLLYTSVLIIPYSLAYRLGNRAAYRRPAPISFWTPRIQEELTCKKKPDNQHDKYAVKVLKDGEIVGHIPRPFSKTCTLILLSGGCMKVCILGKRENKRGEGLEVPCLVTAKVSEYIYQK